MENRSEDFLKELQDLADVFYQNQDKKGVKKLPELTRKLSEFMSELKPEQQQDFLVVLKGILEAIETENYIMLADMLVFEVGQRIEEYQI